MSERSPVANRLYCPACDDDARREPDIGAALRLPFTTNNAHALGVGVRELFVATRCAWLECCCDLDLNQWAIHINFPSTSLAEMFAAEFAPMETDSGWSSSSTDDSTAVQFANCAAIRRALRAKRSLAQRLNTGLVPKCIPAREWWSTRPGRVVALVRASLRHSGQPVIRKWRCDDRGWLPSAALDEPIGTIDAAALRETAAIVTALIS